MRYGLTAEQECSFAITLHQSREALRTAALWAETDAEARKLGERTGLDTIQLQGAGVGGILHRDLGQRKVGVQRGLNGKAVEHPVHQLHGLAQGGAAVGVAEIVAGVGALHHAENIGCTVFVGP